MTILELMQRRNQALTAARNFAESHRTDKGNYLNVHRHFILTRSKKKWVRWLGMGIVDCALVALWVITTDLLVTLFVH